MLDINIQNEYIHLNEIKAFVQPIYDAVNKGFEKNIPFLVEIKGDIKTLVKWARLESKDKTTVKYAIWIHTYAFISENTSKVNGFKDNIVKDILENINKHTVQ